MGEPVVSSRFGKRPLLEVPALQVASRGSIGVPSLQAPIVTSVSNNVFPSAHNPMIGSGIYNPQSGVYVTGGLSQGPFFYSDLNRKYQPASIGPFYNAQGRAYYYGPNGEVVFPPPVYNSGNIYPGVVNPHSGYVTIPPPAVVRVPYTNYGLTSSTFNITCELDFGRIVNIDVRDSDGEFRGIPDFLRTELMRTYGTFPYTEVKIKLEGGEFHIYATHENNRKNRRRKHHDSDSESDYDRYYDRYAYFPEWKSDIDSGTSGVRPRNPGDRPRGIIRERGWNRFR